ncbi:hypothetical protein [Spirosoma sp. KUDC1026]|uniref:hypothetical protein n=1 Tax=Spirosoma sp. KUDC1026 TaxID=2745947 RepID=UPI00159B8CB8|nr:hypothetical protein [Spirosoma sp. KUDC1026]QKZ14430.1 hypothetical protein HU175_18065 [Spirosoma sp. KUDC1026]
MNTISKQICAALLGVAVFSSCSRPVAYFQPSQAERFHSPKTETVAIAPTTTEATQPVAVETPAVETAAATTPEVTQAAQVAQAKAAMSQVEAYVRNDSKLASNKKLTKRIERANEMLATAETKASVANSATSAKKMSFTERMVMKKLDKKIKNHVAPEEAKALSRNVRNGIIIGAIGLILSLLFAGPIGIIGLVLLVVGIVLILLGVLES